jgi:NTP pyrophosphatase (non-canonical NTP hydrolase)
VDEVAWESVSRIVDRLDAAAATPPDSASAVSPALLMRVLKLSEEVGEVAEAVIGVAGQNPVKGVSHTWDDVTMELCDVLISAMAALTTVTTDARTVFAARLAHVVDRMGA